MTRLPRRTLRMRGDARRALRGDAPGVGRDVTLSILPRLTSLPPLCSTATTSSHFGFGANCTRLASCAALLRTCL